MILGKLFSSSLMLASLVTAKACRPRSQASSLATLKSSATTASVAITRTSEAQTTLIVHTTASSAVHSSSSSSKSEVALQSTVSESAAATLAASDSEVFIGLGTRYGDSCTEEDCWQDGACSFVDYDLPDTVDGSTCVSEDIWNNGTNCGGCIDVSYKGTKITVMVTNLTGGNATHLDMTPATWKKLTNGYSGGGVDGIEWEWVTCPIAKTTPLEIHMHNGASKYWFAATVQNARLRTEKLEVSSDQGSTWKATSLNNYNIFALDGTLPDDTAWVRVTSVAGDSVIVKGVALTSGKVTTATANYA